MADNRKNPKYHKEKKRVVDWCEVPSTLYPDPEKFYTKVTYIIDRGNLINDVRKKYTEIRYCNSVEVLEKKHKQYRNSRAKVKRDLESAIRLTGGGESNVEYWAKLLLRSR